MSSINHKFDMKNHHERKLQGNTIAKVSFFMILISVSNGNILVVPENEPINKAQWSDKAKDTICKLKGNR